MRLLDLFCGAGGCSMGYYQAGFEVVGVDIEHQPHYPFEFIQADALTFPLDGFDVIHASPPCQLYSVTSVLWKREHPDLLSVMRQRLKDYGGIWVIENVPHSPMDMFLMLCGSMFGLGVRRHRWFENSLGLFMSPYTCKHDYKSVQVFGHYDHHRKGYSKESGSRAMGIDWMDNEELSESIPPAYTKYIGGLIRELVCTK